MSTINKERTEFLFAPGTNSYTYQLAKYYDGLPNIECKSRKCVPIIPTNSTVHCVKFNEIIDYDKSYSPLSFMSYITTKFGNYQNEIKIENKQEYSIDFRKYNMGCY